MICDFLIIGAGMAGASLAAELAPLGKVIVLEAEDQPGYHATGRSAAFWQESYGGPHVQPLTVASHEFLTSPALEFSERSFLNPRGALILAKEGQQARLRDFYDTFSAIGVKLHELARADFIETLPGLDEDFILALHEPSTADIDVAALHHAYLVSAQKQGVEFRFSAPLDSADRRDGLWHVAAGDHECSARNLVNAAGAWADEIAEMCGAEPLGIRPFRRTMVQARVEHEVENNLPLVMDIGGQFYFKPESGRLWMTPHDEGEADPGDVAADELDVAIAIDRVEKAMHWHVTAVERKWAGLRSFSPDRLPVYGMDPLVEGFFWFAGQGGFGIQTAPAAAKLAASLLGAPVDPMIRHLDPALYAPERFS